MCVPQASQMRILPLGQTVNHCRRQLPAGSSFWCFLLWRRVRLNCTFPGRTGPVPLGQIAFPPMFFFSWAHDEGTIASAKTDTNQQCGTRVPHQRRKTPSRPSRHQRPGNADLWSSLSAELLLDPGSVQPGASADTISHTRRSAVSARLLHFETTGAVGAYLQKPCKRCHLQ